MGGRKEAFEPLDRIEHAAPRLPSVSSPMSCSHPVVASPPVKGNLEERSIYIEKQKEECCGYGFCAGAAARQPLGETRQEWQSDVEVCDVVVYDSHSTGTSKSVRASR